MLRDAKEELPLFHERRETTPIEVVSLYRVLGLHPSLLFHTSLVGVFENLTNFRFPIKSLTLHDVIRYHSCSTIFLQCSAAYFQDFG